MGYTGFVNFNDECLFTEWKSNNTFYCMSYAKMYNKQKISKLSLKNIQNSFFILFNKKRSIFYEIEKISELKTFFMELISNEYIDAFNEKEEFIFELVDMDPLKQDERDILFKNKDLKKFKIEYLTLFSSFDDSHEKALKVSETIKSIKNMDDCLEFIEELDNLTLLKLKKALEFEEFSREFLKCIKYCKKEILNGFEIYTSQNGNTLYFKGNTWNKELTNPCSIDLALEEGNTPFSSTTTITTKKEFENLLTIVNEYKDKNDYLNCKLKNIFKTIGEDEVFNLTIYGGF